MWIIRIASLVGFLIAGYLFYQAMSGAAIAGCGEAASCAEVLASPWSKIGAVPVSAPAMVVYLIILVQTLFLGADNTPKRREAAWGVIVLMGSAAALAALWFIGLQLIVVGKICTYCMTAHACSIIIGAVAFLHGPRKLFPLAVVGVAIMIAAQVAISPPQSGPVDETMRYKLDPHIQPTLGDPDAPVIIGFLFDYNCGHCGEAHRQLQEAIERYDGQLAVVMLPTAINPACNKHVQNVNPVFAESCKIARLALAVYLADAEMFAAFDAFIMEHIPRVRRDGLLPEGFVADVLRPEAERLVGVEQLASFDDAPWIDQRLGVSADIYHQAANPLTGQSGVPRLIIGELAYPSFATEAALFNRLEEVYPQLVRVTGVE